jgi:two-component system, LuxR family, response regulator FixJ
MSASGGDTKGSVDREPPFPVICVVDDDASLLRALRRLLRTGGFRVEVFSSAEGFLQSEHRLRADCLVVDIRLDGMSGLELQESLVAAGSAVPVVFMTAHDDPSTRERASRVGAVDYLRKPFDEEVLIGAINRAIGRV